MTATHIIDGRRPVASDASPLAGDLRRRRIAGAGGGAGRTAKEKELEARVAQLEQMVQQLVAQQQQTQSAVADTQAQVTEVKTAQAQAPAAVPAGKQPIQGTTIMTAANPGTTFSYGGFIKLDAMVTDTSDGRIADGSSGRLFYLPSTIPVGGDGADGGDPYTDVHAQFSRFWFGADTVTDGGDKLKAYIEADFFGGGNNALVGNETSTNTYAVIAAPGLRELEQLAGRPDLVELPGHRGAARRGRFRRRHRRHHLRAPGAGALHQRAVDRSRRRIRRPRSRRLLVDPLIAAPLQQRRQRDARLHRPLDHQGRLGPLHRRRDWCASSSTCDETETGARGQRVGQVQPRRQRRHPLHGQRRQRHRPLHGLRPRHRHRARRQRQPACARRLRRLRRLAPRLQPEAAHQPDVFGGACSTTTPRITGFGVTERAQSFHANVIYSPFPKLDVGAELSFGKRELEDDREGDLKRLQTTVKYSF